MPGSTATWAAPYPVLGDPADINAAVKPLADRLEALLTLIKAGDPATIEGIPIGASIPYTGSVLPNVAGGPVWAWADGSLIDKTTYATFFTRTGHAYNGGVDPGSNKVRTPDKRGRVPMGADNFGVGGASRITVSNALRGGNGGEERHVTTAAELPAHSHTASSGTESADHTHSGSTDTQGNHNHVTDDGTHYLAKVDAGSGGNWTFWTTGAGSGVGWTGWYIGGTNYAGSHAHNFGTGGRSAAHTHAITVNNSTGGGGAHQNLQPYESDNYIVRIG